MTTALMPRIGFVRVLLTDDQKWALNFRNKMALASCVSIIFAAASIIGYGFTDDWALEANQKNSKITNFVHRFFTGTLILGVSAAAISIIGHAYAGYVFKKM